MPHAHLPPRFTVPPLPPRIHRRICIGLHDDGIVLEPSDGDDSVLVRWGVKGKVEKSTLSTGDVQLGGILGIIRLWEAAYLFVFLPPQSPPTPLFPNHINPNDTDEALRREAPASLHEVYTLNDIHAIPLVQDLASKSLDRLRELQTARQPRSPKKSRWSFALPRGPGSMSVDSDSDSDTPEADDTPLAPKSREWTKFVPKLRKTQNQTQSIDPPQRQDLEDKIVRQIKREFASGGFFYSYDFDLTHSLQYKRRTMVTRSASSVALADLIPKNNSGIFPSTPTGSQIAFEPPTSDDFVEPDVHMPLWRRVDRRFFWNEYLLKDFIDLGLHAYVLPVMQGWVQSATFTVPIPPNPLDPSLSLGAVPVDLVVISRRSRDRAGLRYQRRGIDDDGHVANMVETEMILRAKVEGKSSLFSFVQVRGSIPLKWTQSPYSMKPPPVLAEPVDQTYVPANLHFNDLTTRYGPITIINLSEQTGKEGVVTNGYEELIGLLDRPDVKYTAFDFHAKCHGMKWENISELVESLNFSSMGYLWTLQGDAIREQEGAYRTNCIDCLDRTNVVQSAIARRVLSTMLTQLGLVVQGQDVENVFNDVWANNGDTISLCYAHTSALKGDFVRTGKRDFTGMLHDGVSSISRMFYGAVSDFFAQAVISFFLGHRNLSVFSEFLETLQSSDASSLLKLSRIRAAAIDTCSARVLNDGEERIAGWILLSPEERSVKLSPSLEEKVLILTPLAIYVVSFNYPLEKVIGFTRIPLASITAIEKGAYILSTLQEASRDAVENAGFVIVFSPIDESTRYSTYSLRNKLPTTPTTPSTPLPEVEHAEINPDHTEFFAFKVLPRQVDDAESTCKAVVDEIAKQIEDACKRDITVERDVVSLAEAQQATSLLSRMDYAVKRFLWL